MIMTCVAVIFCRRLTIQHGCLPTSYCTAPFRRAAALNLLAGRCQRLGRRECWCAGTACSCAGF